MKTEEEKLGQDPAFPKNNVHEKGMSKRFYAACAAMQGFLSYGVANPLGTNDPNYELIVKQSYKFADELLKQENL